MTPKELKKFRLQHKISLVHLAATVGLPADYLSQIEEDEVPALEKDLDRIEKALVKIKTELEEGDEQDETEPPGKWLRRRKPG